VSGRGNARAGLVHLYQERPDRTDRTGRDRLEILTALITGPSFDPVFRPDVIKIPRDHPVFRWNCLVRDCERIRSGGTGLCSVHREEYAQARSAGTGIAAFLESASELPASEWMEETACRLCPGRPAAHTTLRLCLRHQQRWQQHHAAQPGEADFSAWLAGEQAYPGFGNCAAAVCPGLAATAIGLCSTHFTHYQKDGRPGGAEASRYGAREHEKNGTPVPVLYADEAAFRRWCASAKPVLWAGQVNLLGLRPLLRAEIKWCLFAYAQQDNPGRWDLLWLQRLANLCRARDLNSLIDLDLQDFPRFSGGIAKVMLHTLRLVYFTPADSREAGFLETDHFGVRFPERASHVDLTAVPQRWLRDLLWDHLADLLRSPQCPRTGMPVDAVRRGITELGAFLETGAPGSGHDPAALTAAHMQRFVADQRQRERDGLPSLAMRGSDGKPSTVTSNTRSVVFNAVRKVLRWAMETGRTEELGLDREFITEMPVAGGAPMRPRRPFPDEVARALADEGNLARLAEEYDPEDQGLRDIWETIVITGRRVGEVRKLRWDCIGRYGGLAMFWHDQTKVGNLDASIRIPDRLYDLLAARQAKTTDRFIARHGRRPDPAEQAAIALFPSKTRNADSTKPLSYQWFHRSFKSWVADLDIGRWVPHQARHTLATNLLRNGATLTHIRRYLGHVSDRMAEHYVHLSHSDLEDVLHQVWVAGPGTASPGELLAGEAAPLTREQAIALSVDLSRRSTPAEGGFCTFQPVVDGGACPWKLDCGNCDKFVLSGADLLYWRRKREQWRLLAEGAPDDATADYLHAYFEPTARAIDGLEKALAGLGLLDDALALDMRKPQDYFHRVWSTAFRASDLAIAGEEADDSGLDI
jgi:integrase